MARSTQKNNSASAGSRKAVYAAIGSNLAIAVTKFVAAFFSGSSSMLAEGIHSLIDTANEGFLLVGLKRAEKPANARHPFGYGAEVYFWSFIVSVLIFALGAGFSIFEGVEAIIADETEALSSPIVALVVLGLSFCFEGYSWSVAFREFQSRRRGRSFFEDFRDLKDPSIFVVLFEDSAACIGVVLAAVGITLSWATNMPVFDALGSIAIGLLLAITAVLLAIEVKGLLIGEAAGPELEAAVREGLGHYKEVISVNELRTLHLGPSDVLLTMSLDFADDVVSQKIESLVSQFEIRIRERFPIVQKVFIEVQSQSSHRDILNNDIESLERLRSANSGNG